MARKKWCAKNFNCLDYPTKTRGGQATKHRDPLIRERSRIPNDQQEKFGTTTTIREVQFSEYLNFLGYFKVSISRPQKTRQARFSKLTQYYVHHSVRKLETISENVDLCWSLRMSIQTGKYFISISVGGENVFIEIFQFWRKVMNLFTADLI